MLKRIMLIMTHHDGQLTAALKGEFTNTLSANGQSGVGLVGVSLCADSSRDSSGNSPPTSHVTSDHTALWLAALQLGKPRYMRLMWWDTILYRYLYCYVMYRTCNAPSTFLY